MDARLASLLSQLRLDLEAAATGTAPGPVSPNAWSPRRARVEIALTVDNRGGHGPWTLRPLGAEAGAGGGAIPAHRLTVEFESGAGPEATTSSTAGAPGQRPAERLREPPRERSQPGGAVDAGTLRRRLELVLGGPPGFTTGARAEILADLLVEFDRDGVLEVLRREWVSEFDTGAEASGSVTKPTSD